MNKVLSLSLVVFSYFNGKKWCAWQWGRGSGQFSRRFHRIRFRLHFVVDPPNWRRSTSSPSKHGSHFFLREWKGILLKMINLNSRETIRMRQLNGKRIWDGDIDLDSSAYHLRGRWNHFHSIPHHESSWHERKFRRHSTSLHRIKLVTGFIERGAFNVWLGYRSNPILLYKIQSRIRSGWSAK